MSVAISARAILVQVPGQQMRAVLATETPTAQVRSYRRVPPRSTTPVAGLGNPVAGESRTRRPGSKSEGWVRSTWLWLSRAWQWKTGRRTGWTTWHSGRPRQVCRGVEVLVESSGRIDVASSVDEAMLAPPSSRLARSQRAHASACRLRRGAVLTRRAASTGGPERKRARCSVESAGC